MKNKFKNINILLVDTNTTFINKITPFLKKIVKNIFISNSEDEALEIYKKNENNIDLIIFSIEELNLIKIIRQKNKKIFFILMYEEIESSKLLEIVKYKISDVLPLNIDIKDLLIAVYDTCEYKVDTGKINDIEAQSYINAINKVAIVSKTDLKGNITYANDIFCEIAKYDRSELIGQAHNIVRHPDMPKAAFAQMWSVIQSGETWQGKVKNMAKDGSAYFVNATISPIFDFEEENILEYIAIRFLTTEDENEKREFRKKVIVNLQNNKRKEYEQLLKIEALEKEITSVENLQNELKQEYTRNKKLLSQVSYYEEKISQIELLNTKSINEIKVENLSILSINKELKEKNKKLLHENTRKDDMIEERNHAIQDLEIRHTNQAQRIKDLRDVIENGEIGKK